MLFFFISSFYCNNQCALKSVVGNILSRNAWSLFLSYTDPEMENEEPPSSENDSQNQSAEQIAPTSQEVDLVDQESPEESSLNSQPESLPPADTDNAASVSPSEQIPDPMENHETMSLDGECTDLDNQLQEQSETEEDSNPNVSWGKKVQPIDSILADWNEDIEAFEMMEKDELWLTKESGGRYLKRKGKLWLADTLILSRLSPGSL